MEDISRELEREIARSKPSPYKKKGGKRILIVDDYGEVRSAGHLKTLVYILFVTSIVCFLAAILFNYFFSNQAVENKQLKSKLTGLEKKVTSLTSEKEVLMARLVISGKEPGIDAAAGVGAKESTTTAKEKKPGIKEKPDQKTVDVAVEALTDTMPEKPALSESAQEEPAPVAETITGKEGGQGPASPKDPTLEMIGIEKFTVTRDGAGGDLLVRFDIRNISDKPGGVSGRIFTILKPENKPQKDWLVVPAGPLEKGVPSQYKKGQYFSIAHFKPVKFRIESQTGPDFFKKASIYIFNENGGLMFESHIDITEAEPSS